MTMEERNKPDKPQHENSVSAMLNLEYLDMDDNVSTIIERTIIGIYVFSVRALKTVLLCLLRPAYVVHLQLLENRTNTLSNPLVYIILCSFIEAFVLRGAISKIEVGELSNAINQSISKSPTEILTVLLPVLAVLFLSFSLISWLGANLLAVRRTHVYALLCYFFGTTIIFSAALRELPFLLGEEYFSSSIFDFRIEYLAYPFPSLSHRDFFIDYLQGRLHIFYPFILIACFFFIAIALGSFSIKKAKQHIQRIPRMLLLYTAIVIAILTIHVVQTQVIKLNVATPEHYQCILANETLVNGEYKIYALLKNKSTTSLHVKGVGLLEHHTLQPIVEEELDGTDNRLIKKRRPSPSDFDEKDLTSNMVLLNNADMITVQPGNSVGISATLKSSDDLIIRSLQLTALFPKARLYAGPLDLRINCFNKMLNW